jgi:hypothetical protein
MKAGNHRWFDLKCIYCGARLVQSLRSLVGRTNAEIRQRQQAAITDWTAYGHDAAELTALIAGPIPYEPVKR